MSEKWRSEKIRQPREVAQKFVDAIAAGMPEGVEFHVGGSWRRGAAQIGDIDVVVVTESGHFNDELDHLDATWQRTGEIVLGDLTVDGITMHVDFWCCSPKELGAFMAFITGPQELNVAMRLAALKQGLSLKQKGLMKIQHCSECGQRLPHRKAFKRRPECVAAEAAFAEVQVDDGTEADCFAKIGLDWIDPTDRQAFAGTKKGLPTTGQTEVKVTGSNGATYTVVSDDQGRTACTCPGYTYRRTCKHLSMAASA
jgi:hypothetical protein